MNDTGPFARSPELMSAADTALLVVDVQEKLIRLIPGQRRIIWNIRRLIDGAKAPAVSVLATEQYPKGLGPTTPELAGLFGSETGAGQGRFQLPGLRRDCRPLASDERPKVLLAGIEAHVCIQQTALDLLAAG